MGAFVLFVLMLAMSEWAIYLLTALAVLVLYMVYREEETKERVRDE